MRKNFSIVIISVCFWACTSNDNGSKTLVEKSRIKKEAFIIAAKDIDSASFNIDITQTPISIPADNGVCYTIEVPKTGRYSIQLFAFAKDSGQVWIEDYINNPDDRTYNITGILDGTKTGGHAVSVDGSPLKAGTHYIKVHAKKSEIVIDSIVFTLIQPHLETQATLRQNMQGSKWQMAWSDEFNGSGLPDSNKWSYNIGNWGWGNNEPQYYKANRIENTRQENGYLVIEAHKDDLNYPWTSARLTTAGKQSFLYGKIEFKAKVPSGRGTWAAGWLLGDDYRDELSWPYCGEIDVLECVGYEINDSTGDGLNHASCHTRAYYFKQGNHLTATTPVQNMQQEWHTYGIEWYPDSIRAYVDGNFYYTYDKVANELEWPFNKPQNIILNLAVGGGWGGAHGIDPNWNSHKFLVDYVRVYELDNTPEE